MIDFFERRFRKKHAPEDILYLRERVFGNQFADILVYPMRYSSI